MEHTQSPLLATAGQWPASAQTGFWACRSLFHEVAAAPDIGMLDESLKWGQPAWRPKKPHTGSTLRMTWSAKSPERLNFFVDCKTDLAARMRDIYPDVLENDGQRQLSVALDAPLPKEALRHLADMTFRYHLSRRQRPVVG